MEHVHDPFTRRFHDLMANRVRDVLLVSSEYDAFVLEEDGRLSDRLFVEYSELNLVTMPNLVHTSTASEAMKLLRSRRFDLVVTTYRLEDPGMRSLSIRVKSAFPNMPVVLLALDQGELHRLAQRGRPRTLDQVFLWTGDTRILLAIIKVVEDSLNVQQDSGKGVPVIIMVEDSILHYSTFLAQLYGELMAQSQSLIAEGINALHKLLRMRARPKVLLATSYEQAWSDFQRYQEQVMAVITDVRFPRQGRLDENAGLELIKAIRARRDVPVLIHSSEAQARSWAESHGCGFWDKSAPLGPGLEQFLKEDLGFGDFVFRLPDRTVVARARDMYELEQVVRTVDARSLLFHADRNHFNVWLRARSMFDLADMLADVQASEFPSVEDLRNWLIEVLREAAFQEQQGMVSDFSPLGAGSRWFMRLSEGSLGGKGRGVAFMHFLLARRNLAAAFPGLTIQVPHTVVVGTDAFEAFLNEGSLREAARLASDQERLELFWRAHFPSRVRARLRAALSDWTRPLAVRSSSLLEDSQHQSCAGIYATCFIPNNQGDLNQRVDALIRAICEVYASTFSRRAQAYHESTPFTVGDERMGVVIQEVVGQFHGSRFYPQLSGVALSWNHYPIGGQRPQDGVAMLALGLGHTVVEGGRSVRFAPGCPGVLPHLDHPKKFLGYSQNRFYALDMERGGVHQFDLSEAERDGTLAQAASVYSPDDDQLRENLRLPGPRIITFSNILKWESLPLAGALHALLEMLKAAMGSPVEIEFALDRDSRDEVCLNLLQVRPTSEQVVDLESGSEGFPEGTPVALSPSSVGHGVRRNLQRLLWVSDRKLDRPRSPVAAREVAERNAELMREETPYILVGPGRWGSSDPSLGIPVDITQIGGAAVILEVPYEDREVEPSQGSHFFHELVARRVGYLCLPGMSTGDPAAPAYLDWAWLEAQPVEWSGEVVRQIRLSEPVTVHLDGAGQRAAILRGGPAAE